MGRRRFLKTLSTLGVSAAALNHMTKDALAELTDDPSQEVPRLKGMRHTNHEAIVNGTEPPELEPIYYTIPRDEFVRIETRYDAARKIRKRVGNDPQIHVGVRRQQDNLIVNVTHETVQRHDGDVDEPKLTFSELRESLPDYTHGKVSVGNKEYEVEDIRVRAVETRSVEDDYFDADYESDVPGGCKAMDDGGWTIGHPAYDDDRNEYVWTTASHCVERSSNVGVYQPDDSENDNYIGVSDKYTEAGNGDAATIIQNSAEEPHYYYADYWGGYEDWPIYGTRSTEYLKDMAANGETVYKQGKTTGRLEGAVLEVRNDGMFVLIDCDRSGGDSGGPYFDVNDYGNAYAVGIHNRAGDTDTESKGTTMEYTNNTHNLSL
jgi:hypothetical protein